MGFIGFYWGYIGIMENQMETTEMGSLFRAEALVLVELSCFHHAGLISGAWGPGFSMTWRETKKER